MTYDPFPMTHEPFMRQALTLAQQAFDEGEIPVGALIVAGGKIIGRGYNQTERLRDTTAHAEMLAITAACNQMGAKFLPADATLYVTLEPCLMCAGALAWARPGHIVFGAADVKNGYRKTCGHTNPFHPKTSLTEGILQAECAELMIAFFAARRG